MNKMITTDRQDDDIATMITTELLTAPRDLPISLHFTISQACTLGHLAKTPKIHMKNNLPNV
jgi:hypothetical protein